MAGHLPLDMEETDEGVDPMLNLPGACNAMTGEAP